MNSTKEYIKALESALRIRRAQLIVSIQGGDPKLQGTWVHVKIAIAPRLNDYFFVITRRRRDRLGKYLHSSVNTKRDKV